MIIKSKIQCCHHGGILKADTSGVLFGQDPANGQLAARTITIKLNLRDFTYSQFRTTYLGAQGQISAIDQIIIDDYEKWKEILTVNIIIDSKEYMELKKQLELANIDRRCIGIGETILVTIEP